MSAIARGYSDMGGSQEAIRDAGETPAGAEAAAAGTGLAGTPGAADSLTRAQLREQTQSQRVQHQKPWYLQRKWLIVQAVGAAIGIALLFIILFPVVAAIAQLVLDRAVLNIETISITNTTNTTFTLAMTGFVSHAGIFHAWIWAKEPMTINWIQENGTSIRLGQINLSPIKALAKTASLNQTTTFEIEDSDVMGAFTAYMITQPSFEWHLYCGNITVQADRFPKAHHLHLDKRVTMQGINSFNNHTTLEAFSLPSDHDGGGIDFVAVTGLNNTSPFSVDLGNVTFDLYYQGMYLGAGSGNSNLVSGANNISLSGFLIPQNGSTNLTLMSTLFTDYLNGDSQPVQAKGYKTVQDGVLVPWLSAGLQALELTVPFLAPGGGINPIKSIDIGSMDLGFTEATAWDPNTFSNSVHAMMQLPFGFSVSIGEIANSFNITQNGTVVAGLTTPEGATQSSIQVINATDTVGNLNITIDNQPLVVPASSHAAFTAFNRQLTTSNMTSFQLVGFAAATANLSIGQIQLNPIKFNVTSTLNGLGGLQGDTKISTVDVLGGTSEAIQLSIDLSINNPSSLELGVGDMVLQLFRNGSLVGTTLLPNLTLEQGNNNLTGSGAFTPNDSPAGIQTLNEFVAGIDVELTTSGYSGSTNISSLQDAFEALNMSVILPANANKLLNSTALQILNTTDVDGNSMAMVTVDLSNPYAANLTITGISSSVKSHGLSLGTINATTNFFAAGKSTSTSPNLPLNMNVDPAALFTLTRVLAVDAGEDPTPLDGIVQLGGYQYLTATNADTPGNATSGRRLKRNEYTGFNLVDFVDAAFKSLLADVELTSDVMIGDYATQLTYTQEAVPVVTDSSLNLLLPILAQPIVQKIVNGSVLGIESVIITNPTETSFDTILLGSITNAGPFDAIIDFGDGLVITWNGSPLGTMKMPAVNLTGDVGATLNLTGTFNVSDVDHLTNFTKVLLTEESFDWDISAEGLSVAALGVTVPNILLNTKTVSLKGFNGLKGGVVVNSFNLPSDDPAGGITLTLNTTITNPSNIGMELSTIGFSNFFQSTYLGPASSNGAFTLAPLSTIELPLSGRLVSQNGSAQGLGDVSTVFDNFIHGLDSNVTVLGNNAGPSDVTWLNEGIKALAIGTTLPNQGKLNIISSIAMDQLELQFTDGTSYAPATSTNDTQAAFTIPFSFPIDITALAQNITVGYQGTNFAELVLPEAPATTDVEARIIHLTFSDIPFAVFDSNHDTFDSFLAATTTGTNTTFSLTGVSNAQASTAIGTIALSQIDFDVETTIAGLQGLDSQPAIVSDLDVFHGYPDYLLIKVQTSLDNPSNITIGTGNVSFTLQFEDTTIGSADLSNLVISPGSHNYSTDVEYSPQGSAVPIGETLLANFLQGVTSATTIFGTTGSTDIESLQEAMSELKLTPVNIPALKQNLITSTSLEFPTDIVQTGIAQVTFVLDNPFTASINILNLNANATYEGLNLGAIENVAASISAPGHTNITSPSLPFHFNLDPITIIQLLELRSKEKGVDLGPLPALFEDVLDNPNFHPPINTTVDTSAPTCVSGNQFDVDDAILNALAGMEVTLVTSASTKLDDYATNLAFNQSNVPAITDKTALYLIGATAPPIVQDIVSGSELTFTQGNITNITETGFTVALKGSLLNAGPLDALITFVEPVTVNWQGTDIATISLPPACSAANTNIPDYTPTGQLEITNLEAFTQFSTDLLHQEEFTWTISTNALQVTALGTIFNGVSLEKNITLKAFNGLPGVTISNFQLPADAPNGGGIEIETDSTIPSPAQLGIELGTIEFEAAFDGVQLGPLSATNAYLGPETTTNLSLSGDLVPQSSSQALATIGQLFSQFLAGENSNLSVTGVSVTPPGASSPVGWLTTAFQSLVLSVVLPGQKFNIIDSITIFDMELVMTDSSEAFAPLASSKDTLATYQNPFGFSLQVIQSSANITLSAGGVDAAGLLVPTADTIGGVSTGNVADLPLSFSNQSLTAINDDAFAAFFGEVTDTSSVSFNLSGTADVVAKTAIGDIPIAGIPFDVGSKLAGIDGFGGAATLSNVTVSGSGGNGGDQWIVSPLTTTLNNPSNISLTTNDIALPVYYEDVMIGRAAISPFDLVPGQNVIPSEFHYYPADANDTTAQSFISNFVTGSSPVPLTIKGDDQSTPYASLVPGLEGITIETSVQGLGVALLTGIEVFVTLDTLTTNLVSINFDVFNPLGADLIVSFVQSDSGVNNETYAFFDQAFTNFTIPAGGTANSGTFDNVLLTQGAIAALGIIPLGFLDVYAAQTATVGEGGYTLPWLQFFQPNVPTTYTLDLDLIDLPLPSIMDLAKKLNNGTASIAPDGSSVITQSSASASKSGSASSATASSGSSAAPASSSSNAAPTGAPSSSAGNPVSSLISSLT